MKNTKELKRFKFREDENMFYAHVIEQATTDPDLLSTQKEPLWSVHKDGVEVFKIRGNFGYVNKLIRLIREENEHKAEWSDQR